MFCTVALMQSRWGGLLFRSRFKLFLPFYWALMKSQNFVFRGGWGTGLMIYLGTVLAIQLYAGELTSGTSI